MALRKNKGSEEELLGGPTLQERLLFVKGTKLPGRR